MAEWIVGGWGTNLVNELKSRKLKNGNLYLGFCARVYLFTYVRKNCKNKWNVKIKSILDMPIKTIKSAMSNKKNVKKKAFFLCCVD